MMAVYTGQNPADLVDFNKIRNGGGNYHVFKNSITVKQGNFSRQGLVWLAIEEDNKHINTMAIFKKTDEKELLFMLLMKRN